MRTNFSARPDGTEVAAATAAVGGRIPLFAEIPAVLAMDEAGQVLRAGTGIVQNGGGSGGPDTGPVGVANTTANGVTQPQVGAVRRNEKPASKSTQRPWSARKLAGKITAWKKLTPEEQEAKIPPWMRDLPDGMTWSSVRVKHSQREGRVEHTTLSHRWAWYKSGAPYPPFVETSEEEGEELSAAGGALPSGSGGAPELGMMEMGTRGTAMPESKVAKRLLTPQREKRSQSAKGTPDPFEWTPPAPRLGEPSDQRREQAGGGGIPIFPLGQERETEGLRAAPAWPGAPQGNLDSTSAASRARPASSSRSFARPGEGQRPPAPTRKKKRFVLSHKWQLLPRGIPLDVRAKVA